MSGVLLVAVGSMAGFLLSIPATSLVRVFLWRVGTFDLVTYAGVAVTLLIVAVAASLIPALKLLRLNPAETLKG
jgi:ABC-type antimicrobial peptide transport system permease subunit